MKKQIIKLKNQKQSKEYLKVKRKKEKRVKRKNIENEKVKIMKIYKKLLQQKV